jgi:uncharacterized membrane protein
VARSESGGQLSYPGLNLRGVPGGLAFGRRWVIAAAGPALFAATLIGIGVLGLVQQDFAPIWQPVPKDVPARGLLAYLCACVALLGGAGLLWRSAAAARLLLAYLLLWLVLFRLPLILRAPAVAVSWEGCGETTVIVAAAWSLYARFANEWDRRHLGFASGPRGLRLARVSYGLALLPLGLAHLLYLKETAALVPRWLPAHSLWAGFTGCTYIAAGLALLSGVCARLAAALATLQMGAFTLLVWVPRVASGSREPFVWSETVISWTLTVAAWVVADSWRSPRGTVASSS